MRQPQNRHFDLPARDLHEILRDAEEDLLELRGARIFLTGGTGFFGKWLVGALACADAELQLNLGLTILSRRPAHFQEKFPDLARHPTIEFLSGDVVTFSAKDKRYDYIIHGATDTTAVATLEQEEERERAIVVGTERTLTLARESGARRMLNLSSGAVYGAASGQRTGAREDDDLAAVPLNAYARAKRKAESLCAGSDVDCVTARGFAFLGPHLPLDAHYAAGNFWGDAKAGGPICVRGDGTALRSYLYPTDLVTWLLRMLTQGQAGRAYNLGSDEVTSTAELARKFAAACTPTPEVLIESLQPHGTQNIYLPNVLRARMELQLDVRVKLDEAIRRSLAWSQTI